MLQYSKTALQQRSEDLCLKVTLLTLGKYVPINFTHKDEYI